MGRTILFGGSGLLGSIYLKQFPDTMSVGRTKPNDENHHIRIDSIEELNKLDGVNFDYVVFLIGNSNHHMLNESDMAAFEYNVFPLKKVLAYMKKRQCPIKKFICLTTILLYGNEPKGRPVNEQDEIFPYQNEYVFSKYMAEQVVKFYEKDIPIVNCRISNVYGATTLDRPDLIPTLMKDVLTKENPSVWSFLPVRDFIFANDCCSAIKLLLESDYTGTVNLGTGTSYSIKEVCDIVSELSGKKIVSLQKEVTGVPIFTTDNSLLKSITGWNSQFTLKDGLKLTYNVMKANLKDA